MISIKSKIEWLGHDAFRITGNGIVIYIDPWQIKRAVPADLILITHDHHDHCSPEDIAKIQKDDSVIVTIKAAADKLSGQVLVVEPGTEITVLGIQVSVVPSYNTDKPFHPKEAGHVGFIINLGGERIYHAGDTDIIPEMNSMCVDIALIPVSGTYVMTADQAVEAVRMINPKIAIPMHVGRGIGSLNDIDRFQEKAPVPVQVLSIVE